MDSEQNEIIVIIIYNDLSSRRNRRGTDSDIIKLVLYPIYNVIYNGSLPVPIPLPLPQQL